MEKVKVKKQAKKNRPYPARNLKTEVLFNIFDSFDLDERRALIPQLLNKAKLVNEKTVNHICPDFIKWICSGDIHEWKEEIVEEAWEIWNFLYRRVSGGVLYNDKGRIGACVWNHHYPGDKEYGHKTHKFLDDRDRRYTGNKPLEITREQFFRMILIYFPPDELDIGFGDSDHDDSLSFDCFIGESFEYFRNRFEDPIKGGYDEDLVADPRSQTK